MGAARLTFHDPAENRPRFSDSLQRCVACCTEDAKMRFETPPPAASNTPRYRSHPAFYF